MKCAAHCRVFAAPQESISAAISRGALEMPASYALSKLRHIDVDPKERLMIVVRMSAFVAALLITAFLLRVLAYTGGC
jgi:hypothetical protein